MTCNPPEYPTGVKRCQASPVYICNADELGGGGGMITGEVSVITLQAMTLSPVCALVNGTPAVVTPIVFYDPVAGTVGSAVYMDALGVPVTGTVTLSPDPCACNPLVCDSITPELACYDTGNGSVAVVIPSGTVQESTDPAYATGDTITDLSSFTQVSCVCDQIT